MIVTLPKGSGVRQTQRRISKEPENLWWLSTSKRCSKYANTQGRGAECMRTASTSLFPHTKSGPNTHPLSTHSPPTLPSYLQWTANYIVKCLQTFPVLRLLLSARQCGRGKTTPTIKQGWPPQASQWPTGGQTYTVSCLCFVFFSSWIHICFPFSVRQERHVRYAWISAVADRQRETPSGASWSWQDSTQEVRLLVSFSNSPSRVCHLDRKFYEESMSTSIWQKTGWMRGHYAPSTASNC